MKAITNTTVKITLVLDEEEAQWLEANMQNPLNGNDPSDESTHDRAMRTMLFDVLQKALT